MCVVKSPKVKETKEKEPTIIRNPYLDGIDPSTKALRQGRSSLRIERAGSGATPVAPPATADPITPSVPTALTPASSTTWMSKEFNKLMVLRNTVKSRF